MIVPTKVCVPFLFYMFANRILSFHGNVLGCKTRVSSLFPYPFNYVRILWTDRLTFPQLHMSRNGSPSPKSTFTYNICCSISNAAESTFKDLNSKNTLLHPTAPQYPLTKLPEMRCSLLSTPGTKTEVRFPFIIERLCSL